MRTFIHLFILSIVLSSCHSKSSNSMVDKSKVKNKIDYSDTFYGLRNKKERDSYYFHRWTNIFDEKIDYSRHLSLSSILDMIKTDYNETAIIAKVKNLKFKIISYKKNDDEKAIEYIATVIKCYKGTCPKEIHYRISYEMGDTIYLKDNFPAIVLLGKYDDIFYLNDQFVYFPTNEKLEIELKKIIPSLNVMSNRLQLPST